jgi:DNA polymerase-1
VSFDVKAPHAVLHKLGIDFKGVKFDLKIAAYLKDSSRGEYDLNTMIQEYLHLDLKDQGEALRIKQVKHMKGLYDIVQKKIEELDMHELLYTVEQPLTAVLASMESEGFKVDSEKLNELGKKFTTEIQKIQQEIYNLAGEEFNINSPKQRTSRSTKGYWS